MEVGSSWECAVEQELLILQGDFPGLLALAGVVQTAASSRPLVLSDLQQPDHRQQRGCRVGSSLSQPSLSHCFKTLVELCLQSGTRQGVLPWKEF